jgi:hypothetical protein
MAQNDEVKGNIDRATVFVIYNQLGDANSYFIYVLIV